MRKVLLVSGSTLVATTALTWSFLALGPRSTLFSFLVVWLPMAWLGLVSRAVRPRLPASYHQLRGFERDGAVYERIGVLTVKRLLRRGPLAAFNPDLHLPAERSPANIAHLDQRMRDAEASHAILFVVTLVIVAHAAGRRWSAAAGWTLLFDILLNGYPVVLQRYNRARLAQRFATPRAEEPIGRPG
jgi:Glycosyl-4,4'-diaponeurosporenoate acyltransferase